jgi:hypothetical protein
MACMTVRSRSVKVFCSHSSADKRFVQRVVDGLRARGIDALLDKYEGDGGRTLVDSINYGLETCDVGLVFFSAETKGSEWVRDEVAYLTYAHIQEGKPLIPVRIGENPVVPPLLRHLLLVP